MNSAHRQHEYAVRFDWAVQGADAIADDVDVAVIVDVLSFTTTLTVAVDVGTAVLPYRWNDETAADYAREHHAVLAVGRSQAGSGQISLSPTNLRVAAPARLVLPSPNGSMTATHLGSRSGACVGAALRNATAVADWIAGRYADQMCSVAVIAAGERWPDGSLRPAVEDLWGAGAVIAALRARGWGGCSPEAGLAGAAWGAVAADVLPAMAACASGRELASNGYAEDITIAAEVDSSTSVPLLCGQQFQNAG